MVENNVQHFFVIGVFLYRLTDSSLSSVINSSSFMQSLPVSQLPKLCIQSVNYMYNVASASFDRQLDHFLPSCHVLKMASTVLTVESSDNSDSSDDLTSTDDPPVEMYVLEWWKDNAEDLPNWSCAAKKCDPDSTIICMVRAAERVFLSLLNSSFRDSQEKAFKDYVKGSIMLQYNEH